MFCLDDGIALLEGPSSMDEPATAILPGEPVSRAAIGTQNTQHDIPAGNRPSPINKHRSWRKIALIAGSVFLLITVLGFGLYRLGWNRHPKVSLENAKLSRLTSNGKATVAAISPDGKFVVYAIDENGQQSLWMRQTVTESNVQIVPPAPDVNYTRLIFSPDGNFLFYTTAAQRNYYTATLYQVPVLGPVLGGSPKKLLSNVSSYMALSPDASKIVFKREFPAEGVDALMIANIDGTNERRLAARKMPEHSFENGRITSAPAWSPDGKTIACKVTNVENGVVFNQVAAIDALSGEESLISPQKFYSMGQMAWFVDQSGLLVLAANQLNGAPQLWHLSYPDGEASRVTNDLSYYGSISLTADSKSAVTVQGSYTSSIWTAPSGDATSRARQVLTGAGISNSLAEWTPEGKIVFDSNVSGSRNVWIMDPDGGNRKQLTTEGGEDATVSPDGNTIAFRSDRTGGAHIFRMDADGGNVKQLTNGSGEFSPKFSSDGKWILFNSRSSGRITAWHVPVDGGEPEQFTQSLSYNLSVSPDGKWLIANYREDAPNAPDVVAMLPFGGGQPVRIFDNIPTRGQHIEWTPDSRALIYIDTRGGVGNLWTQPVEGGTPKQITDFKDDRIFTFAYSRDGKQLALSRGTIDSDVVLIQGLR